MKKILTLLVLTMLSMPTPTHPLPTHDHKCLAETISREARGEKEMGMLAVAQVVLNRTKTTICDAVFKPYQFSWTKTWNTWTYQDLHLNLAHTIIHRGWAIKNFPATHFHNTSVNPNWKLDYITQIGNHHFYK